MRARRRREAISLAGALLACGGASPGDPEQASGFRAVAELPEAALLSVSGTSASDVWMVGADGGQGPGVLHWDGVAWARRDAGVRADLWWVQALPSGLAYLGGSGATVLVHRAGAFERLRPPGLARHTVFGVWAASEDDLYAVGSNAGRNGFIWHYDGSAWTDLPLPEALPRDAAADSPGFFKVWGAAADDVWVVGDRGVVLHGSAADGFRLVPSGSTERLFTVHGAAGRVVMVGGSGNGLALEVEPDAFADVTPPGSSLLQGVHVSGAGAVWTVGLGGNVYARESAESEWQAFLPETPVQSLHSVWVDPEGGVWTVGGNVLSDDLDGGVALHRSARGDPALVVPPVETPAVPAEPVCPAGEIDPVPGASIARRWNEQLLAAIRRDLPHPPVHARNLLHLSVAIWDAWSAYDEVATGVVVSERQRSADVDAARREAISYAAYRVLDERQARAAGGARSRACFRAFLGALGYDPLDETEAGDAPRAVGNRIGRAVLDAFAGDGANEAADYADPDGYRAENAPLSADLPGTVVADPSGWQPLMLSRAVTSNGVRIGSGVQDFLGAHWGAVTPFALQRPEPGAPYLGVGGPPLALDAAALEAVVEVISRSAQLGVADGVRWDVAAGNSGSDAPALGPGREPALNPISGEPYAPRSVLRGDFGRVLAEYWTDGPALETPPGHWNVLANAVADDPRFERRLMGASAPLDALAWDVHLYLALNGALHDAAVATWELKRRHASARPISLVRYFAGLGQRSDPAAPAYHADGLPLVEGSIEIITEASSAPGERHAHLRSYVGELALRAWPGPPGDRERVAAVGWIRGKDWVPYQPHSIPSPPFPGYVSDASSFGHAAAAVLGALTGSEYFPGGLGRARVEPGQLAIENGPSEPVELEWATYSEAADQAGQAGVWSGTQLSFDALDGRDVGVRAGQMAVAHARRYFGARP